jgi:hypothetical protein
VETFSFFNIIITVGLHKKKMKKIIGAAVFMVCCFSSTAQVDLKKKIVDSTCVCLSEMPDLGNKSKEEIQLAIGQCMMSKSMSDFMELAQERNIELTDNDAMQKLGMEIGMDLVKSNCKAMTALMLKMATDKAEIKEKDAPKAASSVKGTVKNIVVKEVVYITVLSGARSVQLVWSDYVVNGNSYSSDLTKLKNKSMEFYYSTKDIYSPKLKAYVSVNMITGIKQ